LRRHLARAAMVAMSRTGLSRRHFRASSCE
jgi:hypothetical protein